MARSVSIVARRSVRFFLRVLSVQAVWMVKTTMNKKTRTLYDARRFVIECPAPSTTILLAMKNSIIFISALSLVAMMLASCNSIPSVFAPDETATTGETHYTNETRPERSAEDSVNSISGGHY